MNVAIVFEGDPETPDPSAGHPEGLVRGEFLPSGTDCLVIWREWGEGFEGGYRDHVVGGGIWENVASNQADRVIAALEDPSLGDEHWRDEPLEGGGGGA